ncbi:ADP-ribosyltransferase [Peribacillus simplex]|uniref:Ribonuclease YwqJ n=1 Tax=Peribacillus simplex TaxID=1478 RepID=A0A9W4KW25_9BACI|nr:ADP-ribosyltransferase [Peribacillus simplex]WHX91739.1 ADP-ribosyltransferase [Peribacillus simplex]CAH0178236.1 Putative ribonuclease YwqJ [Peribacillus simplex]
MKIYEAETLTAATKSRAKQYEELKKEVTALKKEFQGIVGLDNEFQGAGATAIKSFYEAQIEVADAWMELFTTQISFLEGIPATLEEADLSGNTVVEVPFLDGEVSNGINQAKSLVDEQANDLQRILNSIDDILTLDMFDQKDFNEKITLAGHRLDDTVTKVENVDRQLVEEYDVSIGQENVAVGLFRALLDATKQDGNISPMTFNQSAFKSSDVYQVKDEVAGQMKDYQTFKKQQAEARKIQQEMEELENRPWYEKAWDTTKTFTGEFTGYYDSIRASTGVDPVTGRKLSDAERIAAGAMAAAGFIPVVGWAGRAIKGGSALYKTAKGLNAANHALDAYKTTKGFSLLQKTEYGIYGLLAANGLGEAATGKDMFGNQLTEEQRQNGLLMALGIGGVAGAAKVADKVASGTKFVPYSKEFAQKQVQKVQAIIGGMGKATYENVIKVGKATGQVAKTTGRFIANETKTFKDIAVSHGKAAGRAIGEIKMPVLRPSLQPAGHNMVGLETDSVKVKELVQKFSVRGGASEATPTFSNIPEAHEWGNKNYTNWLKSLTESERKAIIKYTGIDYQYINNFLRGIDDSLHGLDMQVIDDIKSGLSKASVPHDMQVYRGTDFRPFEGIFSINKYGEIDVESLIGKTIKDEGFISTAIVKESSFDYKEVLWTINIPQGAKAAYVGDISNVPDEAELLLNAGQELFIKEANEDANGKLHLILDLIKK